MEQEQVKNTERTIQISDEVLCQVASIAAKETEGVTELSSGSRKAAVRITNLGGAVAAEVGIVVAQGSRAVNVAKQVQQAVKHAIQDMAGITAVHVNVSVTGLQTEEQ